MATIRCGLPILDACISEDSTRVFVHAAACFVLCYTSGECSDNRHNCDGDD